MVSIDGEPTEVEQRLLNILLAEVGDGIVKEYQFALSKDMDETILYFEESNLTVKNIVFLNLVKVAMSDEFYNTTQHFFLESIRNKFGISDTKKQQLMRLVYQERDLRERAKRVVSH
jgi:hypothetical protein